MMKVRSYQKLLAVLLGGILTFAGGLKSEASAVLSGFNSNTLAANDDGSTGLVSLGFSISYYNKTQSGLFINNNGNVTFGDKLSSFTPFDLTTTHMEILAPFFGDVDTRRGATVTYGEGTVDGHAAFGVNWPGVGYYSEKIDKLNIFQLVIIDRSDTGAGNWDFEFNYNQVQWETGDASSGTNGLGGSSARAGFSLYNNSVGSCLELPGSSVNGDLLDSGTSVTSLIKNDLYSTQPGSYVFSVRNGEVVLPPPAYWLGGVNNQWSAANWVIDPQGGSGMTVPTSFSDVIFSSSGATNENTLLDRDFMIKSLTINTADAVTISGSNTLTILGTVGTTGITVNGGAGPLTINTRLVLQGGSQVVTVNNAAGAFFNGVVEGVIGLEKSGTGTLVLSASNTYTGPTLVDEGTLKITGAIQASSNVTIQSTGNLLLNLADNAVFANTIQNDGTVTVAGSHTNTLSGNMSGVGDFVQNSSGTTILIGQNTYTGQTTISQGTLQVGNGFFWSLEGSSQVNVDSLGALILNISGTTVVPGDILNNGSITSIGSNTTTFSGAISGSGAFVQNGWGLSIFTGSNTSSGSTTVSIGVLQIGNGSTGSLGGSGPVTVGANGILAFNMGDGDASTSDILNNGAIQMVGANVNTLSGVISGTGSLNQNGSGITILSGVNTYTGSTTVANGFLQIGDGTTGTISPSSALVVNSGGMLILNSPDASLLNHSIADNGAVVLEETPFNMFTGAISGTGALGKTGSNTLILSGSNSYTGMTSVMEGTLKVGSAYALPAQTSVEILGGATLDLSGVSQSVGSLYGAGSVITGTNTVTTIGTDNSSVTFSGVIGGAGAVDKVGSGIWNVTGSNTYTGATRLLGGTMLVNGSLQSDLFVLAGTLGGNGTIYGNVDNHALVSPGNSPGVLTISGNYTQDPSGSLLIQIASHSSYDHCRSPAQPTSAAHCRFPISGAIDSGGIPTRS